MSKSEYLVFPQLAPHCLLKLYDNVISPLGVDLHTARHLARREEVSRDGGEVSPPVGHIDVLHGGHRLARVGVHHLYGDGGEGFLAVGQHEVRTHLAVLLSVIVLGHGRLGGVVYARVERVVGPARSHVESRREEALVGDAHLQVSDVRQVLALLDQVAVGFHIGGDQAVLDERTDEGDSDLPGFLRGNAWICHGEESGGVIGILLVRLAVGHVVVCKHRHLAEVVGVVVAAVPVRPEAQVVVARHQEEIGPISAVGLQGAVLHTAVYAVARARLPDLGHTAQRLAAIGTGVRIGRQVRFRHGKQEAHCGKADAAGAVCQRQVQPLDLALRDLHLLRSGEHREEGGGMGLEPFQQVGHGRLLRQSLRHRARPATVGHDDQRIAARADRDVFRGQLTGIPVRLAEEDGAVAAEEVERKIRDRHTAFQSYNHRPLPFRQGIFALVRFVTAGRQADTQAHAQHEASVSEDVSDPFHLLYFHTYSIIRLLVSHLLFGVDTPCLLRGRSLRVAALSHGADARGLDALCHEPCLQRLGAAERDAVVHRPAAPRVTPAREDDIHVGILLQDAEYPAGLGQLGSHNLRAVEREIDDGEGNVRRFLHRRAYSHFPGHFRRVFPGRCLFRPDNGFGQFRPPVTFRLYRLDRHDRLDRYDLDLLPGFLAAQREGEADAALPDEAGVVEMFRHPGHRVAREAGDARIDAYGQTLHEAVSRLHVAARAEVPAGIALQGIVRAAHGLYGGFRADGRDVGRKLQRPAAVPGLREEAEQVDIQPQAVTPDGHAALQAGVTPSVHARHGGLITVAVHAEPVVGATASRALAHTPPQSYPFISYIFISNCFSVYLPTNKKRKYWYYLHLIIYIFGTNVSNPSVK